MWSPTPVIPPFARAPACSTIPLLLCVCAEEQRHETIGRKKKKKRHAEKRCGKAEQIKQSSDLLGFVLAKNAPCILIRSAVQLALTALLMPFRRSELSLFNTSVFLFQDFFFFFLHV